MILYDKMDDKKIVVLIKKTYKVEDIDNILLTLYNLKLSSDFKVIFNVDDSLKSLFRMYIKRKSEIRNFYYEVI